MNPQGCRSSFFSLPLCLFALACCRHGRGPWPLALGPFFFDVLVPELAWVHVSRIRTLSRCQAEMTQIVGNATELSSVLSLERLSPLDILYIIFISKYSARQKDYITCLFSFLNEFAFYMHNCGPVIINMFSVIAKCVSLLSSPVPSLTTVLSCAVEYIYIYIYASDLPQWFHVFFCFA